MKIVADLAQLRLPLALDCYRGPPFPLFSLVGCVQYRVPGSSVLDLELPLPAEFDDPRLSVLPSELGLCSAGGTIYASPSFVVIMFAKLTFLTLGGWRDVVSANDPSDVV